jgi:hypothetical protein
MGGRGGKGRGGQWLLAAVELGCWKREGRVYDDVIPGGRPRSYSLRWIDYVRG